MSAYGIAGLVDGFFKGREIKDAKQDRKDNKKRQEKLDEFYAAEQGRIAERHGWNRDQNGRVTSDWERARADDDAQRRAGQEAIDATDAAIAQDNQPQDQGAPPPAGAATSGPVAGVAANLGIPMGAAPDRFAERMPTPEALMERFFDPNSLGAVPVKAASEPPPAGGVAAQPTNTNAPSAPMAAPEPEFIVLPPQSRAIEDELAASGNVGPRYIPNPRYQPPASPQGDGADQTPDRAHVFGQGLGGDIAEVGKRTLSGFGAVAGNAMESIPDTLRPVSQALDTATRYVTGTNTVEDRARTSGQNVQGIYDDPAKRAQAVEFMKARERGENPQSIVPGFAVKGSPHPGPAPAGAPRPANQPEAMGIGPRISNVPDSAPAATKELSAVADDAMAAISTPSIQAAAKAVAKEEPLGAAGKRPITEKQRNRAAESYMDHYMKEGAPIYVKELLRQGKTDAAIAFQKFLDEKTTQKGIQHWARAAFAATVGDFDAFADEIFEGQNTAGYWGDSITIDKDKSGFTKDDEGNITGAKLTMVDGTTGNTFEQVFNSPADLVNAGMYFASPEVQFENAQKQVEAAREANLGAVNEAKADAKDTGKAELDILTVAKKLLESANEIGAPARMGPDGKPLPPMTLDEAIQMIIDGKQKVKGAMSGGGTTQGPLGALPGPPVLHRP